MFKLFTYKTPAKFADAFKSYYAAANLKQVRNLSTVFFMLAVLFRILSLVYYKDVVNIQNYDSYSFLNWTHMCGTFIFLILSSTALKLKWDNPTLKKAITLSFILYILLIALAASYTVSMFNTKNTLTLFLIGITTVSLFFAIEYIEILLTAVFITFVYWISMAFGKLNFDDQVTNTFAGVILGIILLCFSRYSYYFKSQHFVKIKELEEKNLEIEHLNMQKNEILGFVAHDLRNPLNNIEALSSLLLHDDNPREELKLILNSANHAKDIINDLIDAVKSDKTKVETYPSNLNNFLIAVLKKWHTNTSRQLIFEQNEPEIILPFNLSKLERVMDNLISNAIKFSTADSEVLIKLAKNNNQAEIKVIDHGIGIPENMINQIFEPFSPAGRKGLQGEKSIGLGLHISQLIMEQHEGHLSVQSVSNQGTTFTLALPLG